MHKKDSELRFNLEILHPPNPASPRPNYDDENIFLGPLIPISVLMPFTSPSPPQVLSWEWKGPQPSCRPSPTSHWPPLSSATDWPTQWQLELMFTDSLELCLPPGQSKGTWSRRHKPLLRTSLPWLGLGNPYLSRDHFPLATAECHET